MAHAWSMRVVATLRRYDAEDFEIVRELGAVSFQQTRGSKATRAARCYAANYAPRTPYRSEVLVMLKEVLPQAKDLASNEVKAYEKMNERLGSAFQFEETESVRAGQNEPPVAPLLGYFDAQSMEMEDGLPSTWLVLRWQGVQTLRGFVQRYRKKVQAEQPRFFWPPVEVRVEYSQVAKYLRNVIRGALEALQFCHSSGITHGAVDGSAFLLSSLDVRSAGILKVELANFGFCKIHEEDLYGEAWEEAKEQDLQALGFTVAELIFSTFTAQEGDEQASRGEIERLYTEVFLKDFESMKDFCRLEEKWDKAIQVLDANDGAGWDMIDALLSGSASIEMLLTSEFLE